MTKHLTDQDLVQQTLSGNLRAFEKIVERYQHKIFGVIFRLVKNKADAEDIAQEAFLRCYQNLDKYDQERPFAPWIYRIATNLALSSLRKRQRRQFLPWEHFSFQFASREDSGATAPETYLENIEREQEMASYLKKLKPQDQLAITLRYYEELNFDEIAYIMETTRNNVEVRLSRARKRLRKIIAANQEEVKRCPPAKEQKNSSISTSTES